MNIVSFGEILWDHIHGSWYIGGAPFNLAAHCAIMGASAALVTSVGNDSLGSRALAEAKRCGINTGAVAIDPDLPTGTVEVIFRDDGSHDFIIQNNVAWDRIDPSESQVRTLTTGGIDALCFGTLAQRSSVNRKSLEYLLATLSPRHTFYDVNIRQDYYAVEWIERSLKACTIMKCNDDEAVMLGRLLFGLDLDDEEFARRTSSHYDISTLCITRGSRGAGLFHDGSFTVIPGIEVKVADTVGAGDAFSAAFLRSFLGGLHAVDAARFAVRVGAFVASCRGAVPEYPGEILKETGKIAL